MNSGHRLSMTTAAVAAGLCFSSMATAQSSKFSLPTSLSYSQSNSKQTWNTVLLVSGIALGVGLLTDEGTLTILGGAGVLVSLIQLNQNNSFTSNYFPRGMDMVRSGPMAFGVSPFGQRLGFSQKFTGGFDDIRPTVYATASFKF